MFTLDCASKMFMSESYIHIREDITENDFLDITIKPKWRGKNDTLSSQRFKAQSEMNLAELKDPEEKLRTKSLSNLNYDGDTDSVDMEEEGEEVEEILLKCSICDIEYSGYLDNHEHASHYGDFIDRGESAKKRKYLRKKRRKEREENRAKNRVNFEDYKDWAHLMEEFDPGAERKWTLEYQFNTGAENPDQPKLSKIVIGRGHKNEYPELNNIILFDDVKAYENTVWRTRILQDKIHQNKHVQEFYSLIPTNNTCLFCFTERQFEVSTALLEGRPLIADVNNPYNITRHDGSGNLPPNEEAVERIMEEEKEAIEQQHDKTELLATTITSTSIGNGSLIKPKHQSQNKWKQNIMKKFRSKSFNKKLKLKLKKSQNNKIEEEKEDGEEEDNEEFEVLEFDKAFEI